MSNKLSPQHFPHKDSIFLLDGVTGRLETAVMLPKILTSSVIGIICHPHPLYGGTMDNKVVTTIARAFREIGISSVRFNFRGVGKSDGKYDQGEGEAKDLERIIQWVKQENPESAIYLAGFSFGSYIAAKVAAYCQVENLITIAPPVTHFNFSNLRAPQCPWLIIQGDADEVIEASAVQAWEHQLSAPHRFVLLEGVGHFFHGSLVELKDILVNEIKPSL